jgi:SET domain-containing protein
MDFKERFKTSPPVRYIEESALKDRYKSDFKRKYAKFYKSYKEVLSETRKKQFEAFFRNLERLPNDLKYCSRVSLRYISKKVGYGVFAKEDIAPYSVLHHYVGEIIPTKNLKAEHDSTFSWELFPDYSIDAMKKGNWCRFMNHCDVGKPGNNAVVWEYYTKDAPYIVFTSGPRGIKKGAQILYSYGEEYWSERKSLNLG